VKSVVLSSRKTRWSKWI